MATRKYVNNRVEVVDSQEQSFITPRMIFGYSKTDNFAQVYNEDNFVLTPVGTEKTTGFESGDRALYNVGRGNTAAGIHWRHILCCKEPGRDGRYFHGAWLACDVLQWDGLCPRRL